ncbi:MAG: hypothetical protein HRT57_17200 [Crocinitomicaceae bacterium]|nr:hypothetical protein [Crocinitomicaceae bacterium]
MKFFLLFSLLFIGLQSYGQWTKNPNILNSSLLDVEASDLNNIYAVGTDSVGYYMSGMIFQSNNGGTSWDTILHVVNPSGGWMYKVEVIDSNSIYCTNRSPIFYKTNDAGNTWDTIHFPTVSTVATDAIHFMNTDTGLVSNWYGEIFKTTDAGLNWNIVYNSALPFYPITDISCPTDSTCYACTIGSPSILKSVDGGDSWNFSPSSTMVLGLASSIFAINEDIIIAIASSSTIYKSIDAGITWDSIATPVTTGLQDVYFYDNIGFIVGNNEAILKTQDYGETWSIDNYVSTSTEVINAVHMINGTTAIAVSDLGSVYRLGNFNSVIELSSSNNDFSVYPNPYTNTINVSFTSTQNGSIFINDLLGRKIKKIEIVNQKEFAIDLRSARPGIILITFIDNASGLTSTKSIIKVE